MDRSDLSVSFIRPRHDLALEVLALRHRLMVLKRQADRPKLRPYDRYLWLLLMKVWPEWKNPLISFRPETPIGWQRAGFRRFWRWKSRRRLGRPGIDAEFPYDTVPKYLLRDRDSIYGSAFVRRVAGMGIEQKSIAPRSPWQNPRVERLAGFIRRECLDPVIVFHERQLRQILESYLEYQHQVRPHRSLCHDSSIPRAVEPPEWGKVIEMPQVGGLHHHDLRQAA